MLNSTTESQNEELVDTHLDVYENVDPNETFDDLDYISEKSKNYGEAYIKAKSDAKENKEAFEKKESKDKDRDEVDEELKLLNDSDGTEKTDKKSKKEEKEAEDEEDEEKEEVKEEEKEKELKDAKEDTKAKKVRVKIGDEDFSVPTDAVIHHKVDGKRVPVTIQQLLNDFSGKQSWDRDFAELGHKNKTFEQQVKTFTQQKELMSQKLNPIFEILKDASRDPYEAMEHLIDMVGGNPYDMYERSMNSRLDELDKLYGMSEIERKAYFLEKQNEFLLKSSEKRNQELQKQTSFNQAKQEVDRIRQTFGVSEEQYVEAYEDLIGMGFEGDKVSDGFIAEWASIKPHKPVVEEILQAYEEDIDDGQYGDIVANLSRYLRDGKINKQQLQAYAEETFGSTKVFKELNSKIGKPGPKQKIEEKVPDRIETFDDLLD